MGGLFAAQTLECYLMQEKNGDQSGVLQGTLDIIDEFVNAFGTNANKYINLQFVKMRLFTISGNQALSRYYQDIQASEYLIAMNLYDLALNIHSRFF